MEAAARELHEECNLPASAVQFASEPFTTSDAITPEVHYLIAQTYGWHCLECEPCAQWRCGRVDSCVVRAHRFARTRPEVDAAALLLAGDDAAEAGWFSLEELNGLEQQGLTTRAVVDVVQRGLQLSSRGLLDTVQQ